jgi:RNA polymerase sigma-70 factor (ECF subfamily)
MVEDTPFQDLIRRIRGGDQLAATELVRRYEPAIRRAVRLRLASAHLGSLLDSVDICQSVLGSFFVRAAAGQYELDTPENLQRLLVTMARNKLISQARKERAERRDRRRTAPVQPAAEPVDPIASPDQQAATRDLIHAVYRRLTPEERVLMELRQQGHDWNSIAAQLGDTSGVLRKRLSRALDRVTRQLGLEKEDE